MHLSTEKPHAAENSTAYSSSPDHGRAPYHPASPTSLAYISLPIESDSASSQGWRQFLDDETSARESDDDGPDGVMSHKGRSPSMPLSDRSVALYSASRSPASDKSHTGIVGSPSARTVGASTVAWGRFVLSDEDSVGNPDEEGISEMAGYTLDGLEESNDRDVGGPITLQNLSSSSQSMSLATFNRTRRTIEPNAGCATAAELVESLSYRIEPEDEGTNAMVEERWSLSPRWSQSSQLSPLKVSGAGREGEDTVQGSCWEEGDDSLQVQRGGRKETSFMGYIVTDDHAKCGVELGEKTDSEQTMMHVDTSRNNMDDVAKRDDMVMLVDQELVGGREQQREDDDLDGGLDNKMMMAIQQDQTEARVLRRELEGEQRVAQSVLVDGTEAEAEAVVPILGKDSGAMAFQTLATEIGGEFEQQNPSEAEPHVRSAVLAAQLETPLPLSCDLAPALVALVPLEEAVQMPVSPGRGPVERTEASSPEDEVVLVMMNEET